MINDAGPGAFLSYAITGVLIIMVMRMLGEMATANPSTGSFTDYARKALGGWAGFSVGWLYWYFWVIVVGFEAVAGAKVLTYWFDAPLWLLRLGLMLLMTATNLFSVSSFGEFEFWFAGIKVGAIVVFLVLGALFVARALARTRPRLQQPHRARRLLPQRGAPSSPASSWSSSRWSAPRSPPSRPPSRPTPSGRSPRPTNSVITRIAIFFVGSIFLLAVILPWNSGELGASPYVAAFNAMGIPYADHIMNAVVLTAVLSCLNSGLYTASRMLFVLAARREAPVRSSASTAAVSRWSAILISTVVGFLCVIAAAVSPDTVFLFLLNSSGADHPVRLPADRVSQVILRRRTAADQLR